MKYEVQDGDSLWNISKKHLGRGSKWKKIYAYNYDIIGDNPDLIQPGQILIIPKYKLYLECLKVQHNILHEKIKEGKTGYLNRLFKVQDEIMSESLKMFILSMIFTLFLMIVIVVITL